MAETAAAALFDYAFAAGSFTAFDAAVVVAANAAAINTVAAIAASSIYGSHQKRKAAAAARNAYNAGLEDRLVMTASGNAVRSRVYGRARNVDGVVYKATHGTNKEFYTLVIALAGHEVDAIEQVYFDDVAVALDGSGYVTTAPFYVTTNESASATCTVTGGNGSVTLPNTPVGGSVTASMEDSSNGIYHTLAPSVAGSVVTITGAPVDTTWTVTYQYNTGGSMARVRAYTGAPGQDLSAVLTPLVGAAIASTDKFQGMACLVVTLQYHQDAWPSGVPTISAVMRGAKVYDPRTTTTAWTQNPALIARDWSLYSRGGGCVTAELNEPSFAAAANACDVSTTFTTTSGTETRPLFECGTVIALDANPDEALAEICEAMAGQWGWAGGQLSVRAGVYRAPVATITEDWVTGAEDIAIVSNAPTSEAINIMRPTLADAAHDYVSTPAAEVRGTAYLAADGRELPRELQLGGVTRAVHAQHVAGVLMREAREGLILSLPCNLRAYQLELFDVVAVTLSRFGWTAKTFEVLGWRFSITGGVLLTLRETAAAVYTPDASFGVLNLSTNTNLPRPDTVPQLTGLAATSGTVSQTDGSSIARTAITWTASTSEAVRQSGTVEVQYTNAAAALPSGDWTAAPPASGRATQVDIYGLRINAHYLLRARWRNTLGMAGPWSAHVLHQVAGKRAPRIWRQASAPTGDVADNDVWFDSDDGNKHYVRLSGAWVNVQDAGIAQALSDAAAAQATADGKIDTFWQASAPGSAAEGDIWFDTDDGYKQYRRTSGAWVLAADTRIGQAISDAADAQATADGKVVTFVQTSSPTAEAPGDLWFDSDDGYRLYRWSGSAWVSVRDAGIAQAIADAAGAQGTADGKATTFLQTSAPTATGVGDLWIDTDDANKLYRWSGSAWVAARDTGIAQALTDASNAQATADGKVVTFVQTTAPTADGVGDLWMDSDDGNKVYRWNGSSWVALPMGTGAIAPDAVSPIAAVNQTGSSTLYTSDVDVLTAAIDSGGAPILVSATLSAAGGYSARTSYFGIKLDGTSVYEKEVSAPGDPDTVGNQWYINGAALQFVISAPSTGARTIKLYARGSDAVYAVTASACNLYCEGKKR